MSGRPHLRPVDDPDDKGRPEPSGRVRLRFLPDGADVRVPAGTPIFDAASWNGVAIDSTCGGHGTCKKCKVQVLQGDVPVSTVDPRAFGTDELRAGWRLACRAPAREDLVVHVPPLQTRPKAALVGVGRGAGDGRGGSGGARGVRGAAAGGAGGLALRALPPDRAGPAASTAWLGREGVRGGCGRLGSNTETK